MNLSRLPNGSSVALDDPGEPATGFPRVSITREEGMLLRRLATGRVLEIGTGLGVSTEWLARNHELVVRTVDTDPWVWENVFPNFDHQSRIECYKDRSEVPQPVVGYQTVFIDGNHTTQDTIEDIEFARSVCFRGVIAVHDSKMEPVRTALEHYPDFGYVSTFHGIALAFVGWDA